MYNYIDVIKVIFPSLYVLNNKCINFGFKKKHQKVLLKIHFHLFTTCRSNQLVV